MYFIRIYDACNEIIIIMTAVITELMPFAILSFGLLFALSKVYSVLHMGINDPQGLYS
jgi:hypothetical protein